MGHAVWKAMDFDVISYKKTVLHLTANQVGRCELGPQCQPTSTSTQAHHDNMLMTVGCFDVDADLSNPSLTNTNALYWTEDARHLC